MLISDKTDFKTKTVSGEKEHFTMMKVLIYQEAVIIINITRDPQIT